MEVGDEVRSGDLSAEVVDLPAAQFQDLCEQAGGQGVPFAVHAGHRDPATGGCRADDGVHAHGGDGPLVDGGRRVFLGDADPVGCPFLADAALDRGDHIEQDALRGGPLVEYAQDDFGGRVLIPARDGVPQLIGRPLHVTGVRDVGWGARAHAVNLPRVCPFTALRWWVRGAEITTTAMSSWGRLPSHWAASICT